MENNPHYAPGNLLNMLQQMLGLKNDRQLADKLGVLPSQVSKVRKNRVIVSPALLISMQEETELSISVLRGLMGDYRDHTGPSAKHPEEPPLQCLHQLQHPNLLPAFARPGPAARAHQYA